MISDDLVNALHSQQVKHYEELSAFRGMGGKFKFLGIEHTVVGYKMSDNDFEYTVYLKTNYVDQLGRIVFAEYPHKYLEIFKLENA